MPKLSFASDLKLINIAIEGKNWTHDGKARILDDIKECYLNLTRAVQKQIDSRNLKNCTNDLIYESSDSILTIDIISIFN